MEQLEFFTSAYSPREDSTPAELRSNYPIDWLPTGSLVMPAGGRDGFWVVENEGIMTPISPNLQPRNMSHSYELPNGTEALVLTNSAGCVRLIKTYHCWKRIWLAGEGVQLIIDCDREVVSEPGFGDFLEVLQLPERPKDVGCYQAQGAPPPSFSLHIPVSLAKDGIFPNCDLPIFRADLERDFQLSIFLNIVCGPEASMAHCILINAYVEGKQITRGQLVKHAATVVIEMMDRCKANGSPLCFNYKEVDLDDLLLVDL